MDVVGEHRAAVDRFHDRLIEVPRMGGGEPHASQPPDFRHFGQQHGKITAVGRGIAIAVHVLPEQLDLGPAGVRQPPRFLEDAAAGTASLFPAREGHHAVCAALVAPLGDGDAGPVRVVAPRVGGLERLAGRQAQTGDPAVASLQFGVATRAACRNWPNRTPG